MKSYTWAKGYFYTNVPVFYKTWNIFGYEITIKSKKTMRRRNGALLSRKKVWDLYEKLLTKKS